MKTIKPFRLSTLYRPFSWCGEHRLSVGVYAVVDLKDKTSPKLLSDIELWREVLPELDADSVLDMLLSKVVPDGMATYFSTIF